MFVYIRNEMLWTSQSDDHAPSSRFKNTLRSQTDDIVLQGLGDGFDPNTSRSFAVDATLENARVVQQENDRLI